MNQRERKDDDREEEIVTRDIRYGNRELWETTVIHRHDMKIVQTQVRFAPDGFQVGMSLAYAGDTPDFIKTLPNTNHDRIRHEFDENCERVKAGLRPDANGGWSGDPPDVSLWDKWESDYNRYRLDCWLKYEKPRNITIPRDDDA